MNAQIVLCPGVNDGKELEFSLSELCKLAPNLQSVAVVPVGLTKFREGLSTLKLFEIVSAKTVIDTVHAFALANLRDHGMRICYPADEFYLLAGMPFPGYESYGDFDQLENGVGLLPLLRHEFELALSDCEPARVERHVTIATGVLAEPSITALASLAMEKVQSLNVTVLPIQNRFFGESITVAGLVTGADLIAQSRGKIEGGELLIPAVMLRRERDLFLDGISIEEAQNALQTKLVAVENDGFALLEAILGQT